MRGKRRGRGAKAQSGKEEAKEQRAKGTEAQRENLRRIMQH